MFAEQLLRICHALQASCCKFRCLQSAAGPGACVVCFSCQLGACCDRCQHNLVAILKHIASCSLTVCPPGFSKSQATVNLQLSHKAKLHSTCSSCWKGSRYHCNPFQHELQVAYSLVSGLGWYLGSHCQSPQTQPLAICYKQPVRRLYEVSIRKWYSTDGVPLHELLSSAMPVLSLGGQGHCGRGVHVYIQLTPPPPWYSHLLRPLDLVRRPALSCCCWWLLLSSYSPSGQATSINAS
jgi:hypothetical protein